MNKISLNELSSIFNQILKKLEFEECSEIEVEEDYYKTIPTDKWASFSEDVTESMIEIGSLNDDIEMLKKLSREDKPCMYVDFDRLASLLRAISQLKNPV